MTPIPANRSEARDERLLDRTFRLSVVLKGLDGLLEIVGGVLLLAVAPSTLGHLVRRATQHELSQDSHDFVAQHLLHLTANLNHSRGFGAAYLISHGVVKVVLVIALLKEQRWAYPVTLAFLGAFIAYQLYRMAVALSVGLGLLTAFDVFIVWLVWREYQQRYGSSAEMTSPRSTSGPT